MIDDVTERGIEYKELSKFHKTNNNENHNKGEKKIALILIIGNIIIDNKFDNII